MELDELKELTGQLLSLAGRLPSNPAS